MSNTEFCAGRCKCEALRYKLSAPPLFTHACHCLDCQKRTGEAFSLTTFVIHDELIITRGETLAISVSSRSTAYACAKCKTPVCIASAAFPLSVILKPGTLDNPRLARPQAHIWTCRKQAWLTLPEDVPQFERGYDPEMVWPQESLSRLKVGH